MTQTKSLKTETDPEFNALADAQQIRDSLVAERRKRLAACAKRKGLRLAHLERLLEIQNYIEMLDRIAEDEDPAKNL